MSGNVIKKWALESLAAIAKIVRLDWKRHGELGYWRLRKLREGEFGNDHYKQFYTLHFGLSESDFTGKVVLDIGCGPRGSLEWATMASRRIGLDPLASEYLKLGASRHAMEYLAAPSEEIPLSDATCDIVCSFNSLDHVDNVERSVDEIKRVTRPHGTLLLIVEVNHPPTVTEPHNLTVRRLLSLLGPEFAADELRVYRPVANRGYDSVLAAVPVADPLEDADHGWLSARFLRLPA